MKFSFPYTGRVSITLGIKKYVIKNGEIELDPEADKELIQLHNGQQTKKEIKK